MMNQDLIVNSLYTGFVDGNYVSSEKYRPQLLINDSQRGQKVLVTLINELRNCDEFSFSVAFVTNSGVASLINTFKELEEKKVPGRILLSQYQNFTEPTAIKRLKNLENIDLRVMTCGNHHTKGYLFCRDGASVIVVGSSNLTQNALSTNTEWNIKLSTLHSGALFKETAKEFDMMFNRSKRVDEQWIDEYETIYNEDKKILRDEQEPVVEGLIDKIKQEREQRTIEPNKMQRDAMRSLAQLRNRGEKRGLLISATGTGKTYLSVFDVKQFKAQKMLFIVHREGIAKEAMKSFNNIFGNEKRMGLLTGNCKDVEADFIFCTIQTLSKQEVFTSFEKEHFDYIIVDEVHRFGAKTYQKAFEYFRPSFLLGMSATPERTDGYDIFADFNHNIAHEIRLKDALEEDILSPFHYYGVSDIKVDGKPIDEFSDFTILTSEERVDKICHYAKFYGCDRGRLKGLIFCSRKREAKELSRKLNKCGWRTVALDGTSSQSEREDSIERLENDDGDHLLDYIITVDIFNEGIDIPSVNQIIMLRPTQSSIIFVQQLGRGLRKKRDKEYLTVIDFIGNYANNYLVPIALYGDRSYNKDDIRRHIKNESRYIPGASTINFDPVSRERIYQAIDKTNLSALKLLREDFMLLTYKLGKTPMMMDFIKHGSRDPFSYVESKGSYYSFLRKEKVEDVEILLSSEEKALQFFTKEICNGKRIEEVMILRLLMNNRKVDFYEMEKEIRRRYGYSLDKKTWESSIGVLSKSFFKDQDKKKYDFGKVLTTNGTDQILASDEMKRFFSNSTFRLFLEDALDYSIHRYEEKYSEEKFQDGFILYEKYSRKDVSRILNLQNDRSATMFGYRVYQDACPIFVTYHKEEDISESMKYNDYFRNQREFHWMTRNNVRLNSKEVKAIRDHEKIGQRILLFVKKSDAEGSDFYYMGDVVPKSPESMEQTTIKDDKGKERPIVSMIFTMETPVDESLYQYFENKR